MNTVFRAIIIGYYGGNKAVEHFKNFDNYPKEEELTVFFNDYLLRFENPASMYKVGSLYFEITVDKIFIP